MDWIVPQIANSNFIPDSRLTDKRSYILVTYETKTGRRYVKQAECLYGRISRKIGGTIIAWMPLPEPYKGQ